METDWAAKAMRGELGDTGPEARITWEALGAVYRSEPAPSRYGRDRAGEPLRATVIKGGLFIAMERFAEVTAERDAALARAEGAEKQIAAMLTGYDEVVACANSAMMAARDENQRLRQRLAALEPKPAHDPFREFPSDRRRVGG